MEAVARGHKRSPYMNPTISNIADINLVWIA